MAGKRKNTPSPARVCSEIVRDLLEVVLLKGRPADRVLSALFRQRGVSRHADRRLITSTAYSLFRWWGWLHELAPASLSSSGAGTETPDKKDSPLSGEDARHWGRLLLAAQYMEWQRPPPGAGEFAQAALGDGRKAGRLWSSRPTTPEKRMARIYFLLCGRELPPSRWRYLHLVPQWSRQLIHCPEPLETLVYWLQASPRLWLRLQSSSEERALRGLSQAGFGIDKRASPGGATAVAVSGEKPIHTLQGYKQGLFQVQDLASQCVAAVCTPQPGQRWWDACAGAGGKTLALAELMRGKGKVVASDVRGYKLSDLRRRARRADLQNIEPRAWDGASVDRKRGNFHGVLVDAPCSASGTWRRNPDARWALDPEEIARLAQMQQQILHNAAKAVRSGGVLVYATCSMFRQENEEVVKALLSSEEAFSLEPFPHPLTGEHTDGTLQIWPWTWDSDSMFVCRLRRQ